MKNHTQKLIFTGLLITIGIILAQFISIALPPSTAIIKIGIGQLPLMLISLLFGPVIGLFSGIIQNNVGYFVWGYQTGPYHLGFVLNSMIFGALPALLLRRKFSNDKMYKFINVGFAILFLSLLTVLLFNIEFITENTYITDRFQNLSNGLIYTLIITSILASIAMLVFYILKKQQDNHHQIIFIVSVLLFITTIILTPIWVQQLYGHPYLLQLPLRIIKFPLEAIVYSILLIRLYEVVSKLQFKNE